MRVKTLSKIRTTGSAKSRTSDNFRYWNWSKSNWTLGIRPTWGIDCIKRIQHALLIVHPALFLPAIPPSRSTQNAYPDPPLVRVAVLRVTFTSCKFLSFITHPTVSFKTFSHTGFQNLQIPLPLSRIPLLKFRHPRIPPPFLFSIHVPPNDVNIGPSLNLYFQLL